MKHKTNAGPSFAKATEGRPGLIVALGAPSEQSPDREGVGAIAHAHGSVSPRSQGANTDTVPLSMLSMPDDQEQMQPPEVGDVVSYQVTGKVVAIEGAYARVQRQSINGQELPDAEPDETNGGNDNPQNANQSADGDEGQTLRSDAAGIGMLS